ncbi:3-keto-5-aminohexanoate cleavage protein [Pseudomonas sp. GD04058]|uniref:3-keto-5-aminohexanoate cleavage protein n=1 Tax=Pseudomonas sp. GD04058 TaxID=2975429 RepID=UPI0024476D64|nr:3-keto-5-aminohexanoate cleavage protein [Pseudomonas sp. GD04058]MDG9885763.1 3-keto-5-aminohexanoate cleavage protein [Pseudomonas sp. GD04058]
MAISMFITAAPVGAVPRFVSSVEPKFLADSSLDDARGLSTQALTEAGWEATGAGGLLLSPAASESATVPFAWIRQLGSRQLQQDIVQVLTGSGWTADDSEALTQTDPAQLPFLPPSLVRAIEADHCELLTALAGRGWHRVGSGWWNPLRAASPYVPVTPQAIIDAAREAVIEGAAIVHLHTRDLSDFRQLPIGPMAGTLATGRQRNLIDAQQYDEIVRALHQQVPVAVLNLSTSVRGGSDYDSPLRREHLRDYGAAQRGAEMASLSPGPVIFQAGGSYDNTPGFLDAQLRHFATAGVRPEIEVFNRGILDSALGDYAPRLRETGEPVLFMLVAGVDQYRRAVDGSLHDDSLIPAAVRKSVITQVIDGSPAALAQAIASTVEYLGPLVRRIRQQLPGAQISALLPGPLLRILPEVAVHLGLDGVRVGLEDALTVPDEQVPGGVRKATTAEQVRYARRRLEALGVQVLTAEQTRERLHMPLPEVALFRAVAAALKPFASSAPPNAPRALAEQVLEALTPFRQDYLARERRLLDALDVHLAGQAVPPSDWLGELAVRAIADAGLHVRYFIEERDRYPRPLANFGKRLYALQAINFVRELLVEAGRPTLAWDEALATLAASDGLPPDSYRVERSQFKGADLRLLEYLASIPCRYNRSRTLAVNTELRFDADYSSTMAILFETIHEHFSALRRRAGSDVEAKQAGTRLYRVRTVEVEEVEQGRLPAELEQHAWVVLPSTPTTNYPEGIALGKGLTATFGRFLAEVAGRPVGVAGLIHSGIDGQGNAVVEATMLHNRFALNTPWHEQIIGHSAGLIYDQLLLPRIVEHGQHLARDASGAVRRDSTGLPLLDDGRIAKRLSFQGIDDLPRLHLLAHSSGISTLQQLDNALRRDMQALGYSAIEQEEIFNRAVGISFGSASDINLELPGTPVVDITAYNDIRSLAGTTTADYLPKTDAERDATVYRLHAGLGGAHRYCHGRWVHYRKGPARRVLRLKGVVLREDPVRLHDGHSIRRYLEGAPTSLIELIQSFLGAPGNIRADMIMREFHGACRSGA